MQKGGRGNSVNYIKMYSGRKQKRMKYYVVSRDQPTIAPLEPPWAHLNPIPPDFARSSKIPFFGLGVGSLGGV